jgi:hypothetical protein
MPAFAARLKAAGISLGLYGAASGVTCGGVSGQLGYEDLDMQTLQRWGVGYGGPFVAGMPFNSSEYVSFCHPFPSLPPGTGRATIARAMRWILPFVLPVRSTE